MIGKYTKILFCLHWLSLLPQWTSGHLLRKFWVFDMSKMSKKYLISEAIIYDLEFQRFVESNYTREMEEQSVKSSPQQECCGLTLVDIAAAR